MWGLPKHDNAYGAIIDASLVLSDAELVELDSEIKLPEGVPHKVDLGLLKERKKNIGILTKMVSLLGWCLLMSWMSCYQIQEA